MNRTLCQSLLEQFLQKLLFVSVNKCKQNRVCKAIPDATGANSQVTQNYASTENSVEVHAGRTFSFVFLHSNTVTTSSTTTQ